MLRVRLATPTDAVSPRRRSDGAELDIWESANAIVVEAELPGVDEKDVTVSLANGVLTIKGEKKHEKEEKGENYHLTERSFGSYERAIRLPDTIDEGKVEAKFEKGVLKVTAAKKPEAVKAERNPDVPSFAAIAKQPDATAERLAGRIIGHHPAMPKTQLTVAEIRDVIAYVLALKPDR